MERKVLNIVCLLGALFGVYLIASGVITNRETWRAYVNEEALVKKELEDNRSNVTSLYNAVINCGKFERTGILKSESNFRASLSSKEGRKKAYDMISEQVDIGDYDSYEATLSKEYDIPEYTPWEHAKMKQSGANDIIRNTYISMGLGIGSILLSVIVWLYGRRMGAKVS